jgi:hypothetical protein
MDGHSLEVLYCFGECLRLELNFLLLKVLGAREVLSQQFSLLVCGEHSVELVLQLSPYILTLLLPVGVPTDRLNHIPYVVVLHLCQFLGLLDHYHISCSAKVLLVVHQELSLGVVVALKLLDPELALHSHLRYVQIRHHIIHCSDANQ